MLRDLSSGKNEKEGWRIGLGLISNDSERKPHTIRCPCEKLAENADFSIELSTTCIGQLWIVHALKLEGMEVLGQLKVTGNPECMVCGFGQSCHMSALPWILGEDTRVTPEKFCRVEDQKDT